MPNGTRESIRPPTRCGASVSCPSRARSWRVPRSPRILNLSTGDIEVFVDAVEILNEAKTPPFVIEDDAEVTEGDPAEVPLSGSSPAQDAAAVESAA